MATWLPTKAYRIWKYDFTFNPGPFNQKEHMFATVVATVTLAGDYTSDLFVTQISPVFFNQPWARNVVYQYLITLSILFLGYGLAGLGRSTIVYPDFCIWPSLLPTIAFNRSLHEENGYSFRFFRIIFTRYRYLLTVFGFIFVWTM